MKVERMVSDEGGGVVVSSGSEEGGSRHGEEEMITINPQRKSLRKQSNARERKFQTATISTSLSFSSQLKLGYKLPELLELDDGVGVNALFSPTAGGGGGVPYLCL